MDGLRAHLLQVLALELFDELVQALFVCIDSHRAENALYIVGGWRGVATKTKK